MLATLTPADRCDRCGARAQTSWTGPNGGTSLLFCGHHTKTNINVLTNKGFVMTNSDASVVKKSAADATAAVGA